MFEIKTKTRKLLLALSMIAVAAILACSAGVDQAQADSGTYRNVDWDLTNGVLTIGNGGEQAFENTDALPEWPWSALNNSITSIRFSGIVHGQGNMANMFYQAKATSIDCSGFETSSVTNMYQMFGYCLQLTSFDIGEDFNTASTTNMASMFESDYQLTALALGNSFNTHNVTTMNRMFIGCEGLTSLDLGGNFDTSNVETASEMFAMCKALTSLDLGDEFDTSKMTNTSSMFQRLDVLTSLDLGDKFDTSKVTNSSGMFAGCYAMTSLDLGDKFDMSASQNMQAMFSSMKKMEFFDLGELFCPLETQNMSYMFYNCESLVSLDLGDNFSTPKLRELRGMFSGCSSLKSLDLGNNFNTANISSMTDMFANCSVLSSVTLSPKFTRWDADALLPNPPTPATTGKWINHAIGVESKTPAQLRSSFPANAAAYAGEWVWELIVPSIQFEHTMRTSPAVDLSGISYSAVPTKVAELSTSQVSEGGRPVPEGIQALPWSIAPATTPSSATSTAYTQAFSAKIPLTDVFGSADTFGIPGVYFFIVAETHEGGSSADTAKWSYGNERYLLRVYVENDPDNPGSLKYADATLRTLDDLDAEGSDKADAAAFTSSYIAKRTLSVSKQVEGIFGDKTYDFPIEVTLTLPEWYDGTAIVVDNAIQKTAPYRPGGATGSFTAVYTTALHGGENATFTVPVGTYYQVEERTAPGTESLNGVYDAAGIAYDPVIEWAVDDGSGATAPVDESWWYGGANAMTLSASGLELTESYRTIEDLSQWPGETSMDRVKRVYIAKVNPGTSITASVTQSANPDIDDVTSFTAQGGAPADAAVSNGSVTFTLPTGEASAVYLNWSSPNDSNDIDELAITAVLLVDSSMLAVPASVGTDLAPPSLGYETRLSDLEGCYADTPTHVVNTTTGNWTDFLDHETVYPDGHFAFTKAGDYYLWFGMGATQDVVLYSVSDGDGPGPGPVGG